MMKRLTLLALVIAGCTSSDGPVETSTATTTTATTETAATSTSTGGQAPVSNATEGDVRLLQAGSYGAAASQSPGRRAPFVLVARDAAEYARLWAEHIGSKPMPPVDFARESAVFLLMGPQSTGGYGIDFHEANREGDRLMVNATVRHPSEGAITTQAFTAPFSVFAVRDREFRSVEWMNQGRLLAREDLAR